jgi:transcriptional regulator with XRE-family HTH domain
VHPRTRSQAPFAVTSDGKFLINVGELDGSERLGLKQRGLTRAELGNSSGLSPNYVGGVELGKRDPSLSTVIAQAASLDIPASERFGPTQPSSEEVIEMAKLFDKAPKELQTALLKLLRIAARKPDEPE